MPFGNIIFCKATFWLKLAQNSFNFVRNNSNILNHYNVRKNLNHICIFLGQYIFIETSSPRTPGQKAWLVSDYFNKTAECFTFWYHMYGSSIGSLNIYKQPLGGQKTLIWRLRGNQGNKWYSGQVTADFSNTPHKVRSSRL